MFGIYMDENLPEPKKRGGEPKALQPKSKENVLKALKSKENVLQSKENIGKVAQLSSAQLAHSKRFLRFKKSELRSCQFGNAHAAKDGCRGVLGRRAWLPPPRPWTALPPIFAF